MTKNPFKIILLLTYLLTVAHSVQAEIYKCKDKHGVINFTSVPCGQKSVGIKRPEKKVEFNADGTKKTRRQMLDERMKKEKEFLKVSKREREDRKKKREKLEQHQNKIKQNCERAKKALSSYQRSSYLYDKGKDGKRQILSDAERNKAELDAQRQISYWCR